MSHELHVSRGGSPLGLYRKDQIGTHLSAGTLRPDDLYFDEATRAWIPLGQFPALAPTAPAVHAQAAPLPPQTADEPADDSSDEAEERPSGRRRRRSSSGGRKIGAGQKRKRHPAEGALPGWIACLFAIGAAAGIWAWAQNLSDQLSVSQNKVKALTESVESLRKQNAILLEMAPPNTIRGVMTLEPADGKLAVLSGVSISLYRADDVRRAMLRVVDAPVPVTEEEFAAQITAIQSALPPALAVTLSDSSGRFELPVPQPGEYAILSTAFGQSAGANQRFMWSLSTDSTGEPSPVLSLSEKNSISLRDPKFRLTPARK